MWSRDAGKRELGRGTESGKSPSGIHPNLGSDVVQSLTASVAGASGRHSFSSHRAEEKPRQQLVRTFLTHSLVRVAMTVSQSQTTQVAHTFRLDKVSQGRPKIGSAGLSTSAASALEWQHFSEPTLLCRVTEHTSSQTQGGLQALQVMVEWSIEASQPSSTPNFCTGSQNASGPDDRTMALVGASEMTGARPWL